MISDFLGLADQSTTLTVSQLSQHAYGSEYTSFADKRQNYVCLAPMGRRAQHERAALRWFSPSSARWRLLRLPLLPATPSPAEQPKLESRETTPVTE